MPAVCRKRDEEAKGDGTMVRRGSAPIPGRGFTPAPRQGLSPLTQHNTRQGRLLLSCFLMV